jgi:hypothetical protein
VRQRHERQPRKDLTRRVKILKSALCPEDPPSPAGSEERESNPPTPFEQRFERNQLEDPYSQYYGSYNSDGQLGYASHVGQMEFSTSQFVGGNMGPQSNVFAAPPPFPPPDQHRPSVAE